MLGRSLLAPRALDACPSPQPCLSQWPPRSPDRPRDRATSARPHGAPLLSLRGPQGGEPPGTRITPNPVGRAVHARWEFLELDEGVREAGGRNQIIDPDDPGLFDHVDVHADSQLADARRARLFGSWSQHRWAHVPVRSWLAEWIDQIPDRCVEDCRFWADGKPLDAPQGWDPEPRQDAQVSILWCG